MNKTELIEALSERLGSRAMATRAVESLVDVVLREVAEGGSVGITGFGTFERVERAPRTGRNPRTGEAVPIRSTSTPRFRPGNYFKDVVRDPSSLPAEGLAGVRGGGLGSEAGGPLVEADGTHSSGARRSAGAGGGDAGRGDAAQGSDGAPATVRRSGSQAPRASTTTRQRSSRPTASTGTPETVKAPRPVAVEEKPAKKSAASGGRVMVGGDDITMGMIKAKKAQLAKVKSDEIVAKAKKKAKVEKKADAKGGKGADVKGQDVAKKGKGSGKKNKSKKSKKSKKKS